MHAVVLREPGAAEHLRVEEELVLWSLFWSQISALGTPMGSPREFEVMLALHGRGGLRPAVDHVFPLEEAAAAHRPMEEAGQFGKGVMRIE